MVDEPPAAGWPPEALDRSWADGCQPVDRAVDVPVSRPLMRLRFSAPSLGVQLDCDRWDGVELRSSAMRSSSGRKWWVRIPGQKSHVTPKEGRIPPHGSSSLTTRTEPSVLS